MSILGVVFIAAVTVLGTLSLENSVSKLINLIKAKISSYKASTTSTPSPTASDDKTSSTPPKA